MSVTEIRGRGHHGLLTTRLAVREAAVDEVSQNRKPWYVTMWAWRPRTRESLLKEIEYLKAEVTIATGWTEMERGKARQLERQLENMVGTNDGRHA